MHGGIAPSQTSTVSIQHDFFFLLYKNVVCSVIIGLGRIEMWKTLICHINASIFLFFCCNIHKYLSALMLEIECRLSWPQWGNFNNQSNWVLAKKFPFYRVSVLAHFCPRSARLPHTKKKDCFSFALKLLKPSLWWATTPPHYRSPLRTRSTHVAGGRPNYYL